MEGGKEIRYFSRLIFETLILTIFLLVSCLSGYALFGRVAQNTSCPEESKVPLTIQKCENKNGELQLKTNATAKIKAVAASSRSLSPNTVGEGKIEDNNFFNSITGAASSILLNTKGTAITAFSVIILLLSVFGYFSYKKFAKHRK